MTEVEIVGWYHWLNGHEFEQTLGDSEGQRSLMCCSPWDRSTVEIILGIIRRYTKPGAAPEWEKKS